VGKKPTPRWGWERAAVTPRANWTDDDFKALAETLSTVPDEELCRIVEAAYGDYWMGKRILGEIPRPSQQRAALRETLTHARKLAVCTKNLDEETRDNVKAAWDAIVEPLLFKEKAIRDLGAVPVFTKETAGCPAPWGGEEGGWFVGLGNADMIVSWGN
jgi:hypothetical protein